MSSWTWLQLAFLVGSFGASVHSCMLGYSPTRTRSAFRSAANLFFVWLALLVSFLLVVSSFHPGTKLGPTSTAAVVGLFGLSVSCALALRSSAVSRALLVAVILVVPLLWSTKVLRQDSAADAASSYFAWRDGLEVEPVQPRRSELLLFYLAKTPDLSCSPDDSACRHVTAKVKAFQGSLLSVSRILWWFVVLFVILRAYGQVLEDRADRRRELRDQDLREEVLAQSASVLSFSAAAAGALGLGGVDLSQFGLFVGLVGAGLSVALRDTLGNFVSGLILLWDGTIRENDVITIDQTSNPETGGTYGIVESVKLRYTVIRDRDSVRRLIPNSVLINSVIENWTHGKERKVRLKIPVPVPYTANLKEVKNILEGTCYEVRRVEKTPPPRALVASFADSAIVFSLRFWISDPEEGIRSAISEVHSYLVERLQEIGLTIPFPQLDVHLVPPAESLEPISPGRT